MRNPYIVTVTRLDKGLGPRFLTFDVAAPTSRAAEAEALKQAWMLDLPRGRFLEPGVPFRVSAEGAVPINLSVEGEG